MKKRKIKRPRSGEVVMTLEEFGQLADKLRNEKNCMNCMACVPIGGGDHICDEAAAPCLVLEGYAPSDAFMWCEGRKWVG